MLVSSIFTSEVSCREKFVAPKKLNKHKKQILENIQFDNKKRGMK